jgi:hypothetical protein
MRPSSASATGSVVGTTTKGVGGSNPSDDRAYVHTPGCTLEAHAKAKALPVEFLSSLGVSDFKHSVLKITVLRIPYRDGEGVERAVRIRRELHKRAEGGDERFLWKKGSKPLLYGLDRLDNANEVVIVEGESDCHVLWLHGIAALGLPGANSWKEERDAQHLAGIERIFVIVEPDKGGEGVMGWLARSAIKDRAWIVMLGGHEDPSELHIDDPGRFEERFRGALDQAEPWREVASRYDDAERRELGIKVRRAGASASHPRSTRRRCTPPGAGGRGAAREVALPGDHLKALRSPGLGGGKGAELGRQELHRRARGALPPSVGLPRDDRDVGARPDLRTTRPWSTRCW